MPLGLALARRTPESGYMLRRFSNTIPLVLALLIVAGIVLAVVQVRNLSALVETAYGAVLLAKLALFVLLFALGVFNRLRLTEPAERRDAPAARRLARSIAIETVVAVLIFGVAQFGGSRPRRAPWRSPLPSLQPFISMHRGPWRTCGSRLAAPGRSRRGWRYWLQPINPAFALVMSLVAMTFILRRSVDGGKRLAASIC